MSTQPDHLVAASLVVLAMIGPHGCEHAELRASYPLLISDKRFPPQDLEVAECRLVASGLVVIADGRVLRLVDPDEEAVRTGLARATITPETSPEEALALLEPLVPDPEERRSLIAWTYDAAQDAANRALGAAGEEFVLDLLRADLEQAGEPILAAQCRRVSLLNDALGYDITAPRVDELPARLIEVKTTRLAWDPARIFITRNELRTATHHPDDWTLVLVDASDPEGMRLLGHLTTYALVAHAPIDRGAGRWETMRLLVTRDSTRAGLPSAIPMR